MSVIVKIFMALLDFDSDLVHAGFEKGSHIDIVEKTNHIFVTVLVCKGVFGWQFLEDRLNESLEVAVGDDVFSIHHVDLVSVHYLEEH